MPTRHNEFEAYFTLSGEFDPAEVTARVGLPPTEAWCKGDVNEHTQKERRSSRWSIRSRLEKSKPVVEHIRDVLAQLASHLEEIRAEVEKHTAVMQTVAYFYSEDPWFHFDEDVIAGCAGLNLSIDCDFYTLYSDRREDSE